MESIEFQLFENGDTWEIHRDADLSEGWTLVPNYEFTVVPNYEFTVEMHGVYLAITSCAGPVTYINKIWNTTYESSR